MTLLARIMEWIFLGAWCGAVGSFFYALRYWYAARPAEPSKRQQYRRNMRVGFGVFLGCVAAGFAAGEIAERAGGWR